MPATGNALREVGFQALPAPTVDAVPVTAGYGGHTTGTRTGARAGRTRSG